VAGSQYTQVQGGQYMGGQYMVGQSNRYMGGENTQVQGCWGGQCILVQDEPVHRYRALGSTEWYMGGQCMGWQNTQVQEGQYTGSGQYMGGQYG
jgi:hypothetical protein